MTRGASLPAAASRAGNQLPNGARRRRSTDSSTASQPAKSPSIALDLKLAFEHALNKTAKLKQEEKDRIVTMAVTGIEVTVMLGGISSRSRTNLAWICWRASTGPYGKRSPPAMYPVTSKTGQHRPHRSVTCKWSSHQTRHRSKQSDSAACSVDYMS
jgi:hypothetical protein